MKKLIRIKLFLSFEFLQWSAMNSAQRRSRSRAEAATEFWATNPAPVSVFCAKR